MLEAMALPAWLSRFWHRTPDSNVYSTDDVVLHPGWRRAMLLGIPFAMLAFALGIVFELAGRADTFDVTAYSLSIAALMGFELLLLFYPKQLGTLTALLVTCVSFFLLSKLVFVFFLAPPDSDLLGELTENFFLGTDRLHRRVFNPRRSLGAFWGRLVRGADACAKCSLRAHSV